MGTQKKEQAFHNGIQVDSQEEVMMLMYIEELIENGYAEKVERAKTFDLSAKLRNTYNVTVQMKTKEKVVEKSLILLEDHVYTPEFVVIWLAKGKDTFVDTLVNINSRKFTRPFIGGNATYIEVKPEFDKNNMTRLFKINQKWMWSSYGIFVNLVQPHKLFEETFTPRAYLTTPTGKTRVIHWPVKTLEEYVESLKSQDEPGRECTEADSGETEG